MNTLTQRPKCPREAAAHARLLTRSLQRGASNSSTAQEKSMAPNAPRRIVHIHMLLSAQGALAEIRRSRVQNLHGTFRLPVREVPQRDQHLRMRGVTTYSMRIAIMAEYHPLKVSRRLSCILDFSRSSPIRPTSASHCDHTQVKLIDIEVVELLASKFAHLGPGLTVRMHGRERSGLVSFTHSTVVSICCTSRHTEFDGIVRFALNGLLPPPYEYRSALDLHTASSPIFNEEPNRTLAELGLDESVADGGEITFYVVKRNNTTKVAGSDKRIGKSAVYTVQDDWHPTVRQTDRGMATFLSSLLVFTNYLSGDEEAVRNMHDRVLLYILALSRFPPAVRALHILSENETILPEEIRAVSETMYHLALDAASPTITKGNTTRVFECARILFGVIIERAKRSWTFPSLGTQIIPPPLFSEVSLTCEISGEPLRDPVIYGGQIIERNAARIPYGMRVNRLFVVNEALDIPALQSYRLSTSPFSAAIDMANIEMQIHAPLSLTQVVTPALTLDEEGFNAVYISRGGPCAQPGEDIFLLRPCHGGEVGVDVNVVALRLNPIIEKRKAMGDWDIDAFGSSRTDRVDTREIEEAVVVALDLRFSKRRDQLNLALPNAKAFLVSLDCLRSVGRYIFVGEVMQRDRVPPAGDAARRRQRAVDTLDELQVIYTRLHWRRNQGESVESLTDQNLSMWEDFVAVAVNTVLSTELVNHLLLHLTNLYNDSANILLPNGVPERFIDPFSGEIFSDPVKANDGFIYERTHIETWRALHSTSPMDPTINLDKQSPLVPARDLKCSIMTFLHGRVQTMFHSNWRPLMIRIPRDNWEYIALPHTTSALSILFDLWYFSSVAPSLSRLWQGLQDRGDGRFCGHVLEPDTSLHLYRSRSLRATESPIDTLDLARRACYFMASGAQKSRLESRTMSRLDIVKQAFEAFVNKSEVFDHPIAIGLVTFGREVREVQKITLLKEQFRNTLRSLEADGDTPLYDSLSVAHSMLTAFKAEHPSSALRIICLTDGFDVGSKTAAHTIAAKLQRSGVVIDSIVVQTGDAPNRVHPMSVVTGGYSFCVDTLENALNTVELETVLRIKDRVERERKPVVQNAWDLLRYNNPLYYPMDIVTTETCPERKPHARLHENVLSAQKAAARGVPPFSTDRQRRLMQEIRDVVKSPHPAIDVYAGDDLAFWKIVIEAPEGSPYEGGTFLAYIDFSPDYPRVPPEIRFVTKILHPNINRHGKVCHAALDRSWLVDMTMSLIFQILYGILLTPDTDNPLDLHATMEYNDDTGHHALKVQNLVRKFASKTRPQWRAEMEGE
ncbi:hypothetical protein A0H81_00199 [Grifola frondosa]|uniref:UBC core domain-containing protein n=1 Tax=Grifola frondosa TaxID=5627 RepID=A0A1C7MW97_GRIFR|nr:hypothetical protein A0H81_00199 [Grifola frondosa]